MSICMRYHVRHYSIVDIWRKLIFFLSISGGGAQWFMTRRYYQRPDFGGILTFSRAVVGRLSSPPSYVIRYPPQQKYGIWARSAHYNSRYPGRHLPGGAPLAILGVSFWPLFLSPFRSHFLAVGHVGANYGFSESK